MSTPERMKEVFCFFLCCSPLTAQFLMVDPKKISEDAEKATYQMVQWNEPLVCPAGPWDVVQLIYNGSFEDKKYEVIAFANAGSFCEPNKYVNETFKDSLDRCVRDFTGHISAWVRRTGPTAVFICQYVTKDSLRILIVQDPQPKDTAPPTSATAPPCPTPTKDVDNEKAEYQTATVVLSVVTGIAGIGVAVKAAVAITKLGIRKSFQECFNKGLTWVPCCKANLVVKISINSEETAGTKEETRPCDGGVLGDSVEHLEEIISLEN